MKLLVIKFIKMERKKLKDSFRVSKTCSKTLNNVLMIIWCKPVSFIQFLVTDLDSQSC